ncbi:MAG TPA: DinB family protein [Blastocatellia bacterium]|nr:DinB family protein [Blastocatellia bacterium]
MTNDVAAAFIAESRQYVSTDNLRKIERCVEMLSDEQIWWRPNEESNSVGNLLLHLAGNARQWIISGIGGEPDRRVRQQEFDERSQVPRAELMARLKQTLAEADAVLAGLDAETLLEQRTIQGHERRVLDAIYHVVTHLSMHTGQIILVTKMLTGKDARLTGHFWHHETPPAGNTP